MRKIDRVPTDPGEQYALAVDFIRSHPEVFHTQPSSADNPEEWILRTLQLALTNTADQVGETAKNGQKINEALKSGWWDRQGEPIKGYTKELGGRELLEKRIKDAFAYADLLTHQTFAIALFRNLESELSKPPLR